MKASINLSQSNKNTEIAVNRIKNSLNKLQSAMNKDITNMNRNKNTNKNIRKKLIESNDNYGNNKDNFLNTEINDQKHPPIGYSMFNNSIQTDKRYNKYNKAKSNKEDLSNNLNIEAINYSNYYIPKSSQSRNNFNKGNYNSNVKKNYNSALKWKCMKCGNINLLNNIFCINCGNRNNNRKQNIKNYNTNPTSENNINYINNSYERFDNDFQINDSNNNITNSNYSNNVSKMESNYEIPNREINSNINTIQNQKKNTINIKNKIHNLDINGNYFIHRQSSEQVMDNNIDNSKLTGMTDSNKTFNQNIPNERNNNINNKNEYNIFYKKMNDLYLYGDYLENELKESNDENIKLLEQYKNIKNEVHNLNQNNIKIKQNIEQLKIKENELNKLNNDLKNGVAFYKKRIEVDNVENIKIMKELELENKQNLEKQKKFDQEIENLKKKISLLVKENEEEYEEEKNIKELENNIENEKKEILENNNKYILILKDNDILNKDIEELEKKQKLNKLNNDADENQNSQEAILKKVSSLKDEMLSLDKEIKDNKNKTNNLIDEYKNLIEISEQKINKKDQNNDNITNNEKDEYLIFKEKNNKLAKELLKLNGIITNLAESKDKIIDIYEDEIAKLNMFYLKAKKKTEIENNQKKEKNNEKELDEEKLMKIIKENEEIKNENFEFIKDLDQLAELQKIYQGLIEENKKLKLEVKDGEFNEENKKKINDIITEDNMIEEEDNNYDNN